MEQAKLVLACAIKYKPNKRQLVWGFGLQVPRPGINGVHPHHV